jgi:cbb3-type cytochrome oxidase subunit 3
MTAPGGTINDAISDLKKIEYRRKNWLVAATALLTIVLAAFLIAGVFVAYDVTRLPRKTFDCRKNAVILTLTSSLDSKKSHRALTRTLTLGDCSRISQAALQSSLNALTGEPFAAPTVVKSLEPTTSTTSTTLTTPTTCPISTTIETMPCTQ